MAVEQHAELVGAVDQLVLVEDVLLGLRLSAGPEHLVQRQHRIVAGVVGVVAGRAVRHLALLVAHGEEVGDRDRLVVGDEEAVLRARRRAPGADAGVGARLFEIDRGLRALLVLAGVLRGPFLVRAPAEFGRLQAFRDEALDGPGVPEDVHRLRVPGALGIALGDMDALDAGLLHKRRPARSVVLRRLLVFQAEVVGEVDERLLDEPRHHSRIGAAAGDGGRAAGILADLLANGLAQRVVGARVVAGLGVEIEAEPGFDDGVDVKDAELAAQLHQFQRRGVDRQVDAEALATALGQKRREQLLVVGLCHRVLDKADAAFVEQLAVGVAWIDDDHPRLVELEVTLEERQRAPADRAEADHDDGAGDFAVDRPFLLAAHCQTTP